jgi:predicted nucleic acid-binding protein
VASLTSQTAPPDRFVLHLSLPVRWWLAHLPHARAAERFYQEELLTGRATVAAPDTIEGGTLSELAQDLGQFGLDRSIGDALFSDVTRTLSGMRRFKILDLVSQEDLARPGFLLSAYYGIPFEDALFVVLAEARGEPLLIADEQLRARLTQLQLERPELRVAWLPDLQDPRRA